MDAQNNHPSLMPECLADLAHTAMLEGEESETTSRQIKRLRVAHALRPGIGKDCKASTHYPVGFYPSAGNRDRSQKAKRFDIGQQ